ncbi:MAG: TRAP transporter substrate-binding protein DctP [Spirochaetaceae bacterium]|jgi:TRAP-type C4-dicarboxylate transport system substrate-binding protein|nr:TRAP transporter substrate-binding protein DctP [Spirochaetaceae bacterium]
MMKTKIRKGLLMMPFIVLSQLLFAAGGGEQTPGAGQPVIIKLASMVPEATPWGELLNNMAADWKTISNGEVELVVYHGVSNDEQSLLRQLNQNQIQIAMFSTWGLKQIAPEIMTLSCPFLIRTDEELQAVLDVELPIMEEKISAKGYRALAWSQIGWVYFFSRKPVFVPADLKPQRLGTLEAEPEIADVFKTLGYNIVPIAQNQILVSLTGGQIDAVYNHVANAASAQIFAIAKNMASIHVAPLLGAILMNPRAYNMIPEKYRDAIFERTRELEAGLKSQVDALESSIIDTMLEYGLVINQVSPEQSQVWYDEIDAVLPGFMGNLFDQETYNTVQNIVKKYR